ncbi:YdcF family protein [Candidatus Uhrbacteria bacterium]|nr:YdcF family protein [Candidatus Uhrbacteria bacterium]
MFTFLKIIQPFFLPPVLFFIGLVTVFFLMTRQKRFAKVFLGVIIVLYYVFSIEPTAYFLERTLTRQAAHASVEEMRAADAIVVLGGGAHTREERLFPELGGVSWKRFWHGIEMYRALEGKVPILYVGGSGDPFDPASGEAELARRIAARMGIPEERFWIESESRDTYENGVAVKRILDKQFPDESPHAVVLVTSATHMPRALRVFAKQGINAVYAPADLGVQNPGLDPLSLMPSAAAFYSVIQGLHEWLGIAGYHARGRI